MLQTKETSDSYLVSDSPSAKTSAHTQLNQPCKRAHQCISFSACLDVVNLHRYPTVGFSRCHFHWHWRPFGIKATFSPAEQSALSPSSPREGLDLQEKRRMGNKRKGLLSRYYTPWLENTLMIHGLPLIQLPNKASKLWRATVSHLSDLAWLGLSH